MLRLPGVLATARAACCDARGDRVSTTVSRCWWRAHENCRQRRTPTWIAIRVCTTPNPLMHCARRALHVDAAFNLLAILFCHPNLVCLTLLPIERRVLRHTARYPLCDIAVRGAHSGVERSVPHTYRYPGLHQSCIPMAIDRTSGSFVCSKRRACDLGLIDARGSLVCRLKFCFASSANHHERSC